MPSKSESLPISSFADTVGINEIDLLDSRDFMDEYLFISSSTLIIIYFDYLKNFARLHTREQCHKAVGIILLRCCVPRTAYFFLI